MYIPSNISKIPPAIFPIASEIKLLRNPPKITAVNVIANDTRHIIIFDFKGVFIPLKPHDAPTLNASMLDAVLSNNISVIPKISPLKS